MDRSFSKYVENIESGVSDEELEELEELNEFRQRFSLARQLLVLRRRESLTQEELAARTGIDQAEISRLERGSSNPTLDTLQRLAAAFSGVSIGFVEDGHVVGAA